MSVSGDMPAHGVLIDLLITGNGRFPDLSVQHFHVSKGSATFRVIQAAGSVVVPVGDPAADGFAVDALTAGVGTQTTTFTAKTGIAGGFATGGTGNSTDTWQAPDNQGSRWVNAGATSTGLPSFAGPPGQWQLGWSGYDVSNPGAPIAYFWTPVGNYWPMLRCADCLQTPV